MYFFKQCPKCNGDLATDTDQYGDFVSCLQCGLCRDIDSVASASSDVGFKSDTLEISVQRTLGPTDVGGNGSQF